MTFFLQNLVNAMQWGSFYALIALGYSMVYGVLMLFNFAHGDIFMVGAYIGLFTSGGLIALSALGSIALLNWLILLDFGKSWQGTDRGLEDRGSVWFLQHVSTSYGAAPF